MEQKGSAGGVPHYTRGYRIAGLLGNVWLATPMLIEWGA